MRRGLLLALLLAGAAPAFAQTPSPGYTVTVESPGPVALGSVSLRVRVTGGVREPEFAAYHLRTTGGWAESQSTRLPRVGEELFEDGLDTLSLPNEAYRIEVRVWSDVPPYDPADPRTFARAIVDMAVDNPPPAPEGVQAVTPATSLRIGWDAVPTSDREDFLAYRVFLRKGRTCPEDLAAYRPAGDVTGLLYVDERIDPGDYCVRVATVGYSAVSETVLSPASAPVKISISKGNDPVVQGGDIVFGTTEAAEPPPPPPLGDGEAIISDGEFGEDLPYGPQTIIQETWGTSPETATTREAGVDPRRAPTLMAGALVLLTFASLLLRFLRLPQPDRYASGLP